jgi:hypothetical protein
MMAREEKPSHTRGRMYDCNRLGRPLMLKESCLHRIRGGKNVEPQQCHEIKRVFLRKETMYAG